MAHSTSETAFLTIEKSMPFRGVREHWSNAYHFDQVPADSTIWAALYQSVWALETACFDGQVQFEAGYGHNPGTPPVLVWETDPTPPGEGGPSGTFTPTANDYPTPGDVAAWVRYGTTQKNKLGKPIYLRNYYHGVYWSGTHDAWSTTQKPHFDALAAAMVSGINVSGTTFRRAGPRGAVAQNHQLATYLTTRTLKHRGRRHRWSPSSAPSGYKWILTNVPQEIN